MIVVERSFAVTAAPDAVLAYLRDFANAEEWDPSGVHTSRLGAGPIAPGAHWRHVRKVLGVTAELTYTLVAAEPGLLVFHGRSEGATCVDTVRLAALPRGTKVTYRLEAEMHGLAKLATPIMRAEVEKLATTGVTAVIAALEGTTVRHRFGAATPNRLTAPLEETS